MNFKFIKAKTIISIILGILVGSGIHSLIYDCPQSTDPTILIDCQPPNLYLVSGLMALSTLIIYIIWSLFQKKK